MKSWSWANSCCAFPASMVFLCALEDDRREISRQGEAAANARSFNTEACTIFTRGAKMCTALRTAGPCNHPRRRQTAGCSWIKDRLLNILCTLLSSSSSSTTLPGFSGCRCLLLSLAAKSDAMICTDKRRKHSAVTSLAVQVKPRSLEYDCESVHCGLCPYAAEGSVWAVSRGTFSAMSCSCGLSNSGDGSTGTARGVAWGWSGSCALTCTTGLLSSAFRC
jgi:hypothetical protein